MPVKLLKFPILVVENVIGQMCINDIVSLSTLSKRTTRAIRCCHQAVPSVRIVILIDGKKQSLKLVIDNRAYVTWEFLNYERNVYIEKTVSNIGGMYMIIQKQLDPSTHPPGCNIIYCPLGSMADIMNAAILHFFSVFSKYVVEDIRINAEDLDYHFDVIKAISAVKVSERVEIRGDNGGITQHILKNVEISDTYMNFSHVFLGDPINQIPKCTYQFSSNNCTWMTPEVFYNLNCRELSLDQTHFTVEVYLQFLRIWYMGYGLEKVQLVKFTPQFDVNQLNLDEFNFEWEYSIYNTWRRNITRADGLRASIEIKPNGMIAFFRIYD